MFAHTLHEVAACVYLVGNTRHAYVYRFTLATLFAIRATLNFVDVLNCRPYFIYDTLIYKYNVL